MDSFEHCHEINELILAGNEGGARNKLIKLLDFFEESGEKYTPLVNSLIRQLGLYPYLDVESASWQDKYVFEAFKVDVGGGSRLTLHREQSYLLNSLLDGKDIAVSAPTSFGKSFVIDSFISIKKPSNVMIIVPTIALTDETRRRINRKFGSEYKIITTGEQDLSARNIFIFPQERAIGYVDKIEELDVLVIDEFYKASPAFDKERSPALLRAILKLGKKARQRYFLAPNISDLRGSIFTEGMDFYSLDFNTVFLEKFELYKKIGGDGIKKSIELISILREAKGKTLIYAGTYTNIDKVSTLIIGHFRSGENRILLSFSKWLAENYDPAWTLTSLVTRGVGIHNGQLHRSLSQIQIKLFEDDAALKTIISTSSIIEGVNTSAENVVLWSNLSGQGRAKIKDFSYRNIIGRGGRMFKHFIGKIYILEPPPESTSAMLELSVPDDLVGDAEMENYSDALSPEQIAKIISYKEEMGGILGEEVFRSLQRDGVLQSSNSYLVMDIAKDLKLNSSSWNGLGFLNSANPENWDRLLYRVLKLQPGAWGIEHTRFVGFVKILSGNWSLSIPELLSRLEVLDIGVDKFFDLERKVTFKLASLLGDVNTIQKEIFGDAAVDVSPFVSKVSHAFLPKVVYQLEEYGLPRMISKKINSAQLIDFENDGLDIYGAIKELQFIGFEGLCKEVPLLG
ncbi:DEAD/DEAH box helicase, partial [Pseudomonas aeruginosa]